MTDGRPWTLAIDFGTTATVAVIDDGSVVRLADFGASTRMPSGVFVADDGSLLAGVTAANRGGADPSRYVRTPKRLVGLEDHAVVAGREIPVVDLVAAVLGAAATQATRQAGGSDPSRVVLTHPARWVASSTLVLEDAATRAGLGSVSLVEEPVAAGLEADPDGVPGSYLAVYDLGGGTFDAVVLRRGEDGALWEIAGRPGGLDPMGGESFDAALHRHLLDQAAKRQPEAARVLRDPQTASERGGTRMWWRDLRALKEDLSETTSGEIAVPGTDDTLLITRAELEELVQRDVEQSVDELAATIDWSGVKDNGGLSKIVLAGDASKMPIVDRTVREQFPDTLVVPAEDPKAIVGRGATQIVPTADDPTSVSQSAVDNATSHAPEPIPAHDKPDAPAPHDRRTSEDQPIIDLPVRAERGVPQWPKVFIALGILLLAVIGAVIVITRGDDESEGSASSTTTSTTASSADPEIDAIYGAFKGGSENWDGCVEEGSAVRCDYGYEVTVIYEVEDFASFTPPTGAEDALRGTWESYAGSVVSGRYLEYTEGNNDHIVAEAANGPYVFHTVGPYRDQVELRFMKEFADYAKAEELRAELERLYELPSDASCKFGRLMFIKEYARRVDLTCSGTGDEFSGETAWYQLFVDVSGQEKIWGDFRGAYTGIDETWTDSSAGHGGNAFSYKPDDSLFYSIMWDDERDPRVLSRVWGSDLARLNSFWADQAAESPA